MGIIELILVIVVVGILMWLINTYIPMPGAIKALLNVLVFILLVIYLLQFFGLIKPIINFPTIVKSKTL